MLVANDGGVGVLLGNGDGTFQSALAYGTGGSVVRSVAVGDVNGDGKPDLLVAHQNRYPKNGTVGVLLGNGDGTFQPAVAYGSGGQSAHSVAVGDVNGDGKPDLVMANQSGANWDDRAVGVLLGNGDGTFQTAVVFGSGGHWPFSVTVGDLNADRKPDLVLANYGSSNVGVLLNNTPFCTTPPMITVSTTPAALWPPNGNMVSVTVSGTITDTGCTVTAAVYAVTDEYGKVQPSGPVTLSPEGAYSFTVLLEASRLGADIDGRVYTVTVGASNDASKTGSEAGAVIVPHDQRH
jgi:FG-GAP-like repeat